MKSDPMIPPIPSLFRRSFHPRIRTRLTLSLITIFLLMILGSTIVFWQFLAVQRQTRRLYDADRLAITVLRLHTELFAVRDRIQLLLIPRQKRLLVAGVVPLRADLLDDIRQTRQALSQTNGGEVRHHVQIGTLSAIRSSLPGQIDAMVQLVQAGDWDAAQLRLDNQVRLISEATGTLVDEISAEVSRDEARRIENIRQVEAEAFRTLLLTILLTLMTATFLGWRVSHSITGPLAELDAGAQALAEGDFSIRVAPHGDDELAQMARVFNGMAERLQGAYGELQRSESMFRSLIEHGSDLILLLDINDNILYASPSCGVLLGRSAEDLIGSSALQFIHPDDIEPTRQLFATQLSDAGVSPVTEIRVRPASGQWHTIEILLTDRLEDPDIRGIILNGRDIHARRMLEDQLRQAQKMEAVGRLAAGVAHDFNNLLTVIRGNSELQLLDMAEQNPARASFLEIRDAADRAAALTHQLLAFSRRQATCARVLDLNQVIADVESMLHRLIGEDISLVFHPMHNLGTVLADAGMLQQVVMNLAVNARDAMPGGGALLIETAHADLRHPIVRPGFGHVPQGRYVVLTVSDTGVGMDSATQRRIFEPFFTTKDVGKGTGLGLATVYGIVQQSGGSIIVASAPGRGSTFQIYLPRLEEKNDFFRAVSERAPSPESESILVVQDEESLRMMMEEYLVELGYQVQTSASPLDAAQLCQTQENPPALVVVDLDGSELPNRLLVQTVRQRCPRIRLLYTSAEPIESDPETPFLLKPFSLQGFARKIRDLLDDRSSL